MKLPTVIVASLAAVVLSGDGNVIIGNGNKQFGSSTSILGNSNLNIGSFSNINGNRNRLVGNGHNLVGSDVSMFGPSADLSYINYGSGKSEQSYGYDRPNRNVRWNVNQQDQSNPNDWFENRFNERFDKRNFNNRNYPNFSW